MSDVKITKMGWLYQLETSDRYPLESNKVFDTLNNAYNYIKNGATAYKGNVISVTEDENKDNNGVYYVKSVGTNGELVKLLDKNSQEEPTVIPQESTYLIDSFTILDIDETIVDEGTLEISFNLLKEAIENNKIILIRKDWMNSVILCNCYEVETDEEPYYIIEILCNGYFYKIKILDDTIYTSNIEIIKIGSNNDEADFYKIESIDAFMDCINERTDLSISPDAVEAIRQGKKIATSTPNEGYVLATSVDIDEANGIAIIEFHYGGNLFRLYVELNNDLISHEYSEIIPLEGGGEEIEIDSELSVDSTNPVQNKVITEELNKKANAIDIPKNVSELNNDSYFVTSSTLQENYQPKGEYLTETELIKKGYIKDVDDELSDASENPVQNKTINAKFTEISEEIKGKQSTINDLDTIRSGAGKGATAVQPSTLTNYATIEFVGNAIQTAIINELNSDF